MAYATYTDVEARMNRTLSASEQTWVTTMLGDAATMIDLTNTTASDDVKKLVSCRMVIRVLGSTDIDVPVGATQGTVSGLGFSQTFTVSNGSTGQLYLESKELKMLGLGNKIDSYSPVQNLVGEAE